MRFLAFRGGPRSGGRGCLWPGLWPDLACEWRQMRHHRPDFKPHSVGSEGLVRGTNWAISRACCGLNLLSSSPRRWRSQSPRTTVTGNEHERFREPRADRSRWPCGAVESGSAHCPRGRRQVLRSRASAPGRARCATGWLATTPARSTYLSSTISFAITSERRRSCGASASARAATWTWRRERWSGSVRKASFPTGGRRWRPGDRVAEGMSRALHLSSHASSSWQRRRCCASRSKSASVLVRISVYGRPTRRVWCFTGSSAASTR